MPAGGSGSRTRCPLTQLRPSQAIAAAVRIWGRAHEPLILRRARGSGTGSLAGTPPCSRPRAAQRTTTVPCIEGWMWQGYSYVPAGANVRSIDTFALFPAMSAGAPACCLKNTLCGTDPNANVTLSPAFTSSVLGVKVRDAVAATVLPAGGGGGGAGGPWPVLPPHDPAITAPARGVRAGAALRADMGV